MLKFFALDQDYINLNHGTFGSVPRPVQDAYTSISDQIESNPDYFGRLLYYRQLDGVRSRLAKLVNAHVDECVIVPNVAYGVNTILRNFEWNEGDIIITTNTAYEAIQHAISYIANRHPHPTTPVFAIQFPTSHANILSSFTAHVKSLVQDSNPTETGIKRKVVAIFDTISSQPGVLWPWKQMVEICREYGVWSVVDAAHSLGQEIDINLKSVDPDFWIANCNKWLYAKRGCALLYVPSRNQAMIKDTLIPALIYPVPGLNPTPFIAKFYWSGSADFAIPLSINAALDFRAYIGGEDKINEYCHQMAIAGGNRLAQILGTSVMDAPNNELTLNMVNVELPLQAKPSGEVWFGLQNKLLEEGRVYAVYYHHNAKWWVRVSSQVYNEMSDFEKLGQVLKAACREITSSL
ncbi:hypothetical protein AX16_002961 [Volvariella volvacea WC 439]|nr:hypothetical protein AX16_002961 [Volvariella volvacea WC 439]